MNDLIHDINRLQKVVDNISKNTTWNIASQCALNDLRQLIQDKEKQLKEFEINNMSYEQYAEHMKGRGFNG